MDNKFAKKLTKEQYDVCFLKGTEAPGSGKYYKHSSEGKYICVACRQILFNSDNKYDSKTGWPAFWDVVDSKVVKKVVDESHGMNRVEVVCSNCGSHLGHVFTDGPEPTGLRYCINSLSLDFIPVKNDKS